MIEQLHIDGFRNLARADLEFSRGINLFQGPNGSGKTNLLEAIGLFGLGKSCRGARDNAMIEFDKPGAAVAAAISNQKKNSK